MTLEIRGATGLLPDGPTLLGQIDLAMQREARQVGERILTEVRAAEPAKTGELRRETRLTVSKTADGWKIKVAVRKKRVHVAKWVEDGTGIYGPRHRKIRPRKAKAFKIGGREVRSVKGQRPQRPFARTAGSVIAADRALAQASSRIVEEALRHAT